MAGETAGSGTGMSSLGGGDLGNSAGPIAPLTSKGKSTMTMFGTSGKKEKNMMDALNGPKKVKKVKVVDLGKKGSFKVRKGALHRALGVPEGQKIPASKLAGHHTGRLGRMIASAKGFAGMKKV